MRYTRTTKPHERNLSAGKGSKALASFLAVTALALVLALGLFGGGQSVRVAKAEVVTAGSYLPPPPKEQKANLGTEQATPTATVDDEVGGKAKTPTVIVNMTPISEQGLAGWERDTLRDLAHVLGWSNAIIYDSSGRLKVQTVSSENDWAVAHVRAFDYDAGARAAFSAEYEDTRLAGYRVAGENFYSYRSYSASLTNSAGVVVERRIRWLANTWILGVDVHRSVDTQAWADPREVADIFLSLAVRRGFPPPPNGNVPTPNPTWSLPPVPSPTARACQIAFSDVPYNQWAYGYIRQLACEGIVSGYGDGTFRPDESTTRAQLVKMLVLSRRGWGLVNPERPTFTDVPPTHTFYRYIETAASHHLISGYGDGTFRPDNYVTRAQVAKMLVLALDWTSSGATVRLCDVDSTHWAWPYVQLAVQHGLYSGYGDGCFRPDQLATRAQLAKVLSLSMR